MMENAEENTASQSLGEACDEDCQPPAPKRARQDEEGKDLVAAENKLVKAGEMTVEGESEERHSEVSNLPAWYAQVKTSQWWYYLDNASQSMQGPYYPGQMRDWFQQGYFTLQTLVAPSFQGEMPQRYAQIGQVFPNAEAEAVFLPGEGVALYPPEEIVTEEPKEITQEEVIQSLMPRKREKNKAQLTMSMQHGFRLF